MSSIEKKTRRDIFRLGAAASVLAAPMIMTRSAFAQQDAQGSDTSAGGGSGEPNSTAASDGEGFVRYQLGDTEIFVLQDGGRTAPEPGSIFGTDQSKEDVSALLEENFLPTEAMRLTFQPTLIRRGSDVLIFDTGNENAGDGQVGNLTANMQKAGLTSDDVTHVVFTHLHPDHVGGTTTPSGDPTFPNASYFVDQTEYDFWTSDERMGSPAEGGHQLVMSKLQPFEDQITFLNDGDEVVSGISAKSAYGHTPGHTVFMVDAGGRQLCLTGDTCNHFVLSLMRPDWQVKFDMDKEMAAQARKDVFGMLASERIPFIGYHFPFPSTGYVEALDTGFRFIPETYQFDVSEG